jgi:hypothetical protein
MRAATLLLIASLPLFHFPDLARAATNMPQPDFSTTKPEVKKVRVENTYYYRLMQYEPLVQIKLLSRPEDSSYKTPEEALISILSAMFAKNYNWWLQGWTQSAISFKKSQNQKENRTADGWVRGWTKLLINKQAILTHRAETGNYVILGYKLIDAAHPANTAIDSELDFTFENGRWLATNDLASDPVGWGWRTPEKVIQGTVRRESENPKEIFRGLPNKVN